MDFIHQALENFVGFLSQPETLHVFVSNRFLMILLVVFLLKIKYMTYTNIGLSALVNICGTSLHEIAHFVTGLVLNAQPTNLTLWPRKIDGRYVLGQCDFRNIRFYNAFPAALAPLMLLVLGYMLNKWFFANIKVGYLNYIGYIFLQTVLIENALPSRQDIKVAFSNPLGVVMYVALILALMVLLL